MQNRSLIGLLRDDLSFGDRVGEGFGRRRDKAKCLDGALRGVGAHPAQRGDRQGLSALGQYDVDSRVVGHRRSGCYGLGDDLSLRHVLRVGVGDCPESQAGLRERLFRVILTLASNVGHVLHVHSLGHVELDLGTLMDGFAALRIGTGDRSGRDVVRKLLLDGGCQAHCVQLSLHLCQRTTVGSGHGQVRARAILGPPPAAANTCRREQEDDEAHPQGRALIGLGRRVL